MYKALTYLNLPPDNRKAPGDQITREELEACDPPQEEENIQALLDSGAISEDMDAEIHPDHLPVDPAAPTLAKMVEEAKILVDQGYEVPDEVRQLSELDYQHVTSGDVGLANDSAGG